MKSNEKPIINCHTHIFTQNHIPPYIAKTFIIWPFYMLLHVGAITGWVKAWFAFRNKQLYASNSLYNRMLKTMEQLDQKPVTKWILRIFTVGIFINVLLICFTWLSMLMPVNNSILKIADRLKELLRHYHLYIYHAVFQVLAVAYILLLFPDLRRLLIKILQIPFKFLKTLPGEKMSLLLERYMLLGKFALHKDQSGIYTKLNRQYPKNTKFIVLPMDMEEMKAGKVAESYDQQLNSLIAIKQKDKQQLIKPFVFIDPRRIKKQATFFNWQPGRPGEVLLDKACDIHKYIIDNHFSGFKIYPALGYYPFDEDLLPLWKYAADNQLPIMTHTTRGTIYYRGKKEKAWLKHPVFRAPDGSKGTKPLELDQKKNINFTVNFTHPMNYLCLLSEPLLRIIVGTCAAKVQTLFGYNGSETPMNYDLSHLKICLAHFGGEEEWEKYLEKDRYFYAQQLIQNRDQGLEFFHGTSPTATDWNRLYNYWSYVDWYSIICSLMLQYTNVYSDISYILSKPRILPLLNETLDETLNPKLREKVLFGTDFYLVRNHFSEKDLLAQIKAGLTVTDFDQIARENPVEYLKNTIQNHENN